MRRGCPERGSLRTATAAWPLLVLALSAAPHVGAVSQPARSGAPALPRSTGATVAVPATPATGAPGARDALGFPICRPNAPLCYSASSETIQHQPDRIVAHDVAVVDHSAHGLLRLRADMLLASGAALSNSRWQLTGHVHVWMPQGQLQADSATVQVSDNHIGSISTLGSPVRFEGTASGRTARAHGQADTMVYDATQDRLKLAGSAFISDGCNDLSDPHGTIVYDIASRTIRAGGVPGSQVHGNVRAHSAAPCAQATGP